MKLSIEKLLEGAKLLFKFWQWGRANQLWQEKHGTNFWPGTRPR